ncbi:subtilase-type protease inhibitor [Streptomyces sp. LP11]|uniref:Subtilase-type protease inhibitor n=1 Tax=Streptomyces pyxinicus TaxID=2970331 RepID=A0ABT2AZG6_9ACTN|nr:subtilase-type protease inhibitor [Streptomyces sp. LP11]MCS0601622.1 subtilase-type protease inhibitor [Streptomyces sp. LP11]
MVSSLQAAGRRVLVSSLAAVASLVPLTAVPAAAAGAMPPPVRPEDQAPRSGPAAAAPSGDHLTVVVRNAGARRDGTYQVSCHPDAGRHPDVAGACRTLDEHTRWGRDPFAPVPAGSDCTMLYGGAATAHVTGTWAGRPVDATYDRRDGCEIGRWDRMVPVLPKVG